MDGRPVRRTADVRANECGDRRCEVQSAAPAGAPQKIGPPMNRRHFVLGLLPWLTSATAETPKLKIALKNGSPLEQRKKDQIERLAGRHDLKKWTITTDIIIEQGVQPHSSPVLTLNGRFIDNDELALSQYVHEQGHWLLMERYRPHMNDLFRDLKR